MTATGAASRPGDGQRGGLGKEAGRIEGLSGTMLSELRTMLKALGVFPTRLLLAQAAQVQESGQDPRVAEAKTACGAGDFQTGVRRLAELYTASNDP